MDLQAQAELDDRQSLSGATLAEVNEVEDRDQEELLGAGSNFHWRIRITPPATRRFSLSSARGHEVVGVLSCNHLPSTVAEFREYLNSRCPNTAGRGFRLRCGAWPMSPYSIVPVQFSDDLHFSTISGEEVGESWEALEVEALKYLNLIQGCKVFARECPRREVEFEIKIVFSKAERTG